MLVAVSASARDSSLERLCLPFDNVPFSLHPPTVSLIYRLPSLQARTHAHALGRAMALPASPSFALPHVPPSGLALLRRLPDTLAGPLQLAVRRHLLRDWVSAQGCLRGTTLIITTRASPTLTVALDVRHVNFVTSPSARRPTLVVRSTLAQPCVRLRLTHRAADWVRALTSIATVPIARLAHFDVVCPIGKGGGGEVYVVRDARDARAPPLAMKVVQKHAAFASPATLRRALDERLALELVRGFPFVVRLTHAFQTASALYMATIFCPGGDLRGLLRRTRAGRLSQRAAKPLLAQIVLALEHVHSLRIVFRDLKPDNVLLSADGDVRLCDFGLCKVLPPARPARARSFCGSTMYMSPQVVSAKPYGFATDLWSLGALFFRVLVGRAPFEQPPGLIGARNDPPDVHARIMSDAPVIPTLVSREARQLLLGLLRKHEEERMTLAQVKASAFFADVDWRLMLEDGYKRALSQPTDLAGKPSSSTTTTTTTTMTTMTTTTTTATSASATVLADDVVEGLSNFDSERLISHGVKLEDEELMRQRRSGRLTRGAKSDDRERQPRAARTSSLIASPLTTLFSRESNREAAAAATRIVGFNFSTAEGRPLYHHSTSNEDLLPR